MTTSQALAGVPITRVRDLGAGLDTATPGAPPSLPWAPSDLMITLWMEQPGSSGGAPLSARLTLRASGTETKLKFYLEVGGCAAGVQGHHASVWDGQGSASSPECPPSMQACSLSDLAPLARPLRTRTWQVMAPWAQRAAAQQLADLLEAAMEPELVAPGETGLQPRSRPG